MLVCINESLELLFMGVIQFAATGCFSGRNETEALSA